MGKLSGGQTGVLETTQDQQPWDPQQPHLMRQFGEAQKQFEAPGPDYYPGATTVPFAPETEQALAMRSARARAGAPGVQLAKQELGQTAAGDYLKEGNPYLRDLYERSARPVAETFRDVVAPSIAGRFMGAGRFGSGAMKDVLEQQTGVLGRTLGDLSASIYAPAYEAERGRMQSAAGMLPRLAATDYADIGQLECVGRTREEYGQRQIQDAINRYEFEQQKPASKLAQYQQFIRGNYGGPMTKTQPIYSNKAGGILGGAATGAAITNIWPELGMLGLLAGGILGGMQ